MLPKKKELENLISPSPQKTIYQDQLYQTFSAGLNSQIRHDGKAKHEIRHKSNVSIALFGKLSILSTMKVFFLSRKICGPALRQ